MSETFCFRSPDCSCGGTYMASPMISTEPFLGHFNDAGVVVTDSEKVNPLPGNVTRRSTSLDTYDKKEEREVADLAEANIVTSEIVDNHPFGGPEGWHKPVLDLDFPAKLVPSSTAGHFHLYLDMPMPWESYTKLLLVMAECGILESGYVDACINRGYSAVRLPWVKK